MTFLFIRREDKQKQFDFYLSEILPVIDIDGKLESGLIGVGGLGNFHFEFIHSFRILSIICRI